MTRRTRSARRRIDLSPVPDGRLSLPGAPIPKGKKLSDVIRPHPPEVRAKAIELAKLGLSRKEIATELGIPYHTIADWIRRYYPVIDLSDLDVRLREYAHHYAHARRGGTRKDPVDILAAVAKEMDGVTDERLAEQEIALLEMMRAMGRAAGLPLPLDLIEAPANQPTEIAPNETNSVSPDVPQS